MKRPLLAACLLLAACAPALADRLHLDGGGVIVTDRWWVEGDVLFYVDAGGKVGLPRSILVRAERTEGNQAAPEPASPLEDRAPGDESPEPAKRLVSREAADRMRRANEALAAHDYETAASLYSAVMNEVDPELMEPRVGYALARIKMDDDAMAMAAVLDGLARDPDQPALLELLGDLRNREERVRDALEAWREAFRRTPNDRLLDKIAKAERELHAGRDYDLSMSSHFNLRYDGEVDDGLAASVSEYLEEQYWEMADAFDVAPRQPITVVLYPRKKFRDVTQAPEWVGGLYDGKIRVPLGGLDRMNPVAEGLLRHELTHAFVHVKSRGQSPRWLHEGLAQIMERRVPSARDRKAVVQRLRDVEPVQWDAAGFSYPLSLSLTLHARELRGLDGLVRVLEQLAEGADVDAALREVLGYDYAELCRDWAASTLQEGMR